MIIALHTVINHGGGPEFWPERDLSETIFAHSSAPGPQPLC
jgi:hypothetical protein